ncbi:MAG: nucleoside 2-deoxyribosyltransferase [Ardenticatenaceae bacterium]
MKAYIAIKYHPDHKNRATIEKISAALEQNGIDSVCITRDLEKWGLVDFSPEELMQKSFDYIDNSDFLLIELTEKGVGIGIEAGYAWAKQIPIITIAKKGADISKTLQGISQNLFWYDEEEELIEFFAQAVQ